MHAPWPASSGGGCGAPGWCLRITLQYTRMRSPPSGRSVRSFRLASVRSRAGTTAHAGGPSAGGPGACGAWRASRPGRSCLLSWPEVHMPGASHFTACRRNVEGPPPLLSLDAAQFPGAFRSAALQDHSQALHPHPLLQLPRLVQLAGSLGSPILYFRGDHAINQVDDMPGRGCRKANVPGSATGPPGTLGGRDDHADRELQRLDAAARCRAGPRDSPLLAQLIGEFRAPAESVAPGLSAPRADIFVSSAGATTPFHLDEEHNSCCRFAARSRLPSLRAATRKCSTARACAPTFVATASSPATAEHLERHSVRIELRPGEGVHIPPCYPHWVQNGAEVSVSLGVLWFSDVTAHRRHLYRVNGWLERAGLHPAAPGERPWGDALKALPLVVKRRLRRLLRA